MQNNQNGGALRRFFRNNGLYLALCCCVVAAAVLSYNAAGDLLHRLLGEPDTGLVQQQAEQPLPVRRPLPVTPAPAAGEADPPQEQQTQPAAGQELFQPVYQPPLEGEVLFPFSNYELVKSETMGDWRTHNGADIAAQPGEEVRAVYAGVVTRTEQDPLWGVRVAIKLDTGYEVVYAALAETGLSEGQRVSQGDVVGTVGSAPVESALQPHLHFEVKNGITYMDPAVLLAG